MMQYTTNQAPHAQQKLTPATRPVGNFDAMCYVHTLAPGGAGYPKTHNQRDHAPVDPENSSTSMSRHLCAGTSASRAVWHRRSSLGGTTVAAEDEAFCSTSRAPGGIVHCLSGEAPQACWLMRAAATKAWYAVDVTLGSPPHQTNRYA
jgi:hypothetical protein